VGQVQQEWHAKQLQFTQYANMKPQDAQFAKYGDLSNQASGKMTVALQQSNFGQLTAIDVMVRIVILYTS